MRMDEVAGAVVEYSHAHACTMKKNNLEGFLNSWDHIMLGMQPLDDKVMHFLFHHLLRAWKQSMLYVLHRYSNTNVIEF